MSKEISFVDIVNIKIESGNGGDGAIFFRREKFVPNGGPSGGDGGTGGSVILQADTSLQTLLDFRFKHKFAADCGEKGRYKAQYGKKGEDLIIKVPLGTIVRDKATNRVIADLTDEGQTFVAAKGGRGGRGNIHFASSVNKAPHYSEPGGFGQKKELILELKSIADVGLVGLPNAGKSSLLATVSSAKPKIANYPFTTLTPNLGVVKQPGGDGFVMADIPGIIEGASNGLGLGHKFLRHVERTRLLIHIIDISDEDPLYDFETINHELQLYFDNVEERQKIIVLNKTDLLLPEDVKEIEDKFREFSDEVFCISTATREGIQELVNYTSEKLQTIPKIDIMPSYTEEFDDMEDIPLFEVEFEDDYFFNIISPRIEKLLELTDIEDQRAFNRFMKILTGSGVIEKLKELGATEGSVIKIGSLEFDFLPD